MGLKVVLDTNVLGAALTEGEAGRPVALEVLEHLDNHGHEVWLPTIVVAELGVLFHSRGAQVEWGAFLALVRQGSRYRTRPLDLDLADSAAALKAKTKLKMPDAIVAATALAVKADVVISDDPDLKRVRDRVRVLSTRKALALLRKTRA